MSDSPYMVVSHHAHFAHVRDRRSGRDVGPLPRADAKALADDLNSNPAPVLRPGEPLRMSRDVLAEHDRLED